MSIVLHMSSSLKHFIYRRLELEPQIYYKIWIRKFMPRIFHTCTSRQTWGAQVQKYVSKYLELVFISILS